MDHPDQKELILYKLPISKIIYNFLISLEFNENVDYLGYKRFRQDSIEIDSKVKPLEVLDAVAQLLAAVA